MGVPLHVTNDLALSKQQLVFLVIVEIVSGGK